MTYPHHPGDFRSGSGQGADPKGYGRYVPQQRRGSEAGTLVLGCGDRLHTDEGIGPHVVDFIRWLDLPRVHAREAPFLNGTSVRTLPDFETALLVDVTREGPPVRFRRVDARAATKPATMHAPDPGLLLSAAYGDGSRRRQLYVCSVRGEDFGFGLYLSPAARERTDKAIGKILKFLQKRSAWQAAR